jgi:hypothetical protein
MNSPNGARLGLISIFGSTFFQLVGYFMLLPLLLLRLKGAEVSTTVAGLFAATGWLGVFLMTPFASAVTRQLGRRPTLWLAAALPALAALGFALTETLWIWFALELLSGAASGLRWVLAEAVVAEFSPPGQRGRYIGIFETLVGATFVVGPATLVWVGAGSPMGHLGGDRLHGYRPALEHPDSQTASRARRPHRARGAGRRVAGTAGAPHHHAGRICRRLFRKRHHLHPAPVRSGIGPERCCCCPAGICQRAGQRHRHAARRYAGRPVH